MTRPWRWIWLAALAACQRASPAEPGEPARARESVVLIVIDTLRADHADSSLGRAATPHFDALAADGVRFTRAFSHVPMTLPSHASLFAGRAPYEARVTLNGLFVPRELPLLAELFGAAGYARAATVSLATLWPSPTRPALNRGFERYVFDGAVDYTKAERITQNARALLDDLGAGPPFLLFAHYSDPHDPYESHGTVERTVELLLDGAPVTRLAASELGHARCSSVLAPGVHEVGFRSPDAFRLRVFEPRGPAGLLPHRWLEGGLNVDGKSARVEVENPTQAPLACELFAWLQDALTPAEMVARYRLEVEYADGEVGSLLQGLRERGLYDPSWIVLLSDHGEALGEHGVFGHTVNVYEEQLHVPLMIKPPRAHPRSAELAACADATVVLSDVLPTLCDLLDLPTLDGQTGASILARPERRLRFAETHRPLAPKDLYALCDGRRKLIFDATDERFELFDLADDPAETRDLFATHGAEHAAWQAELRRIAVQAASTEVQIDPGIVDSLKALGY